MCVSKLADKQNKIDFLNKDIFELEKHYQKLKNDGNNKYIFKNLFK